MNLNLDKSTWERVRFGDVVRNVNESVKDAEAAGIDRVIALEHLDPSELKIVRWGDVADGTTFTKRVRPGQTLFGKRRAYQRKAAFAEFEAITSGDILVFEANPARLLPTLLPFLVQSEPFFAHALDTSAGSLSPRTNWGDLAKFEFDLPPLDEQQRIADLLWALEASHLSLASERESLVNARDAHVKRTIDQSGGVSVTLESIASITSGLTLGPARAEYSGRAAYLRVANVQRGALDLSEIKEIPVRDGELESKSLRSGDVLVVEGHASATEVGRAALWAGAEEFTFQNHLFRVRAGDAARPEFVLEMINSASGRHHMRTWAKSTSGLNTINSKVVKSLPIILPGLAEQDRILRISGSYEAARASITEAISDVRSLVDDALNSVFGAQR